MLGTESAHDSGAHFRYLSGLLLAIGLGFLSTVPHIERRSARFRLLGFIVIIGGLSRLLGLWAQDASGPALWLPLLMELCITPLLCFWQARLAKAHDK